MTARVRVPASSSNLGAGFDCIGVAVDRWLVASVTLGGTGISILRRGTLSAVRVRADQDLFTRGFRAACAAGGASPAGTGATIEAASDIPVGCGLGSSAAAIVAGALLADAALDPKNVVAYANRCAALVNKGETDQALSDCNKAILLDPKNAPTRFGYQ